MNSTMVFEQSWALSSIRLAVMRAAEQPWTISSVRRLILTVNPISVVIWLNALLIVGRFLGKLITERRYFRKLRAQGLPMPPHNIVFGHIPVLIETLKLLPKDAHPTYLPYFIKKTYPELGPDFYLDLYPFAPSMLVIGSPETLHQATVKHALDKTFILKNFLEPLTQGLDMVSTNGPFWKKWRAIFNPGFSSGHLVKLTPIIVKECEVYCQQIDKHVAKQDIFEMKSLTDNLILDVIGQLVLDIHLGCQESFNQVVHSLRTQIKWMTTGVEFNLINRWNPARPFIQWYHSRIVDRYIGNELDQRIKAWQQSAVDVKKDRIITDLALNAYTETQAESKMPAEMDDTFRKICLAQLKIFLFAGHDTTSSATCFHLWALSQNPSALSKLRLEHDSVFGPDPTKAAAQLIESPHLANQLPYTTAVIRESLRLFPPVTSSRKGEQSITLIDSESRVFPTENIIIWLNQQLVQRDDRYWVDGDSFRPERFLVGAEDPLYPVKGMWRPFEQGPRNCLGQELAMLEMKIVLVLVCRVYDILPAYEELDRGRKQSETEVLGDRAYQVDIMQPRGNLPVRVVRREKGVVE